MSAFIKKSVEDRVLAASKELRFKILRRMSLPPIEFNMHRDVLCEEAIGIGSSRPETASALVVP
eukprot:IDg10309t1